MRVRYRQHRSSCREGRRAAHRAGALCPLAVGAPRLAPWAGGTCGCATSLGVLLSVLTRRDRAFGLTLRGFELVLPLRWPCAVLELCNFPNCSCHCSGCNRALRAGFSVDRVRVKPELPSELCIVIHAADNATQLLLSAATYPGHSTTGLAAGWEAAGDAACLLEPVIVG